MSDNLAFVDTETTGLDPDRHEIWEAAAVIDGEEFSWLLPVDLGLADAFALSIGRYHERHPGGRNGPRANNNTVYVTDVDDFATEFADITAGRHLVGAVISFDEERLRKLLRANGACPEWHYHLVDVEALAAGWLAAQDDSGDGALQPGVKHRTALPPWDADELSRAVGVDPDQFGRHTALGDARWAKAIYEAVMGQ